MKTQRHVHFHVNIPLSAYFYPTLHHNGNWSIAYAYLTCMHDECISDENGTIPVIVSRAGRSVENGSLATPSRVQHLVRVIKV